MAKDNNQPKLTQMFKVGYSFQAPTGNQLRTGALLVRAATLADATHEARKQLANEYDWFKITKTSAIQGDEPQQSL